jgi:hypothetical protein
MPGIYSRKRAIRAVQHQTPITKPQGSSNFQAPNFRSAWLRLRFDCWGFRGAWGLGIGVLGEPHFVSAYASVASCS